MGTIGYGHERSNLSGRISAGGAKKAERRRAPGAAGSEACPREKGTEKRKCIQIVCDLNHKLAAAAISCFHSHDGRATSSNCSSSTSLAATFSGSWDCMQFAASDGQTSSPVPAMS